jgi:transglutaminase-like putative cysteine protease
MKGNPMGRKILYLIAALFLIQILSGCTWFEDEPDYRGGFESSGLVAPAIPYDNPKASEEKPDENESQLAPGYSYSINWALSDVYASWGGYIWIYIENTGDNDIFIYRYGISINWTNPSKLYYEEYGAYVEVGEEVSLGLVYFKETVPAGNYGYRIALSLLIKDNELEDMHGIESWFDNKTVYGSENELEVLPLFPSTGNYDIEYNYRHYYDKVQDEVDFENSNVRQIANDVKKKYPGNYNLYQAIEAYDHVLTEFDYIKDPSGKDVWYNPGETCSRGGGDCEDLAILFSSVIGALGGTTRIFLSETHAFSGLFIGNGTTKTSILNAIEVFYGSDLNFVILDDGENAWLSADTAGGSLYLGGMPADAGPVLISSNNYDWYFEDTDELHAVDVVG